MVDPLGLRIPLSVRFPVLRTGLFELLTPRAGGNVRLFPQIQRTSQVQKTHELRIRPFRLILR